MRLLSNGTDGLFQPTSKAVSASLTDSGSTLDVFTSSSTTSTQFSELTAKDSPEVVTRLLRQMQLDPPVVAVELRPEESRDASFGAAEVSPYTDTPHNLPSAPPHREKQKEQKGFRIPRLRELLGLGLGR